MRSEALWLLPLLLPVGGLIQAATPQGARDEISTDDLRKHVSFLASDTLEGRAAGTRGGQAAAAYLQSEFRRLGLAGAGDAGGLTQEFGRGYRNLLALLPGRDPDLQHETVIVCGHFDHVGYGNSSNSLGPYGYIHNGADDNASGTAAIIEVAEAIAQLEDAPRRTILFALWDAEEAGLQGSYHWTRQPTRDLKSVKLVINVDMVGRLRDEGLSLYGVRSMAGMRQFISHANQVAAVPIEFDWTNRDDSDHWPFALQQIPYVFLHTGDHPDYHRPSDDIDKLNLNGMQQIARLMFDLTLRAANDDRPARFRPECRQEGRSQQLTVERQAKLPPRLGINWQRDRQPGEAFRIERVHPGSPAAQAGLRPGDTLTRFGDREAEQIDDLTQVVFASRSRVQVGVTRPGAVAPMTLEVELLGSPLRMGLTWREDAAEPGVAIVTGVMPGSPAAAAGLAANDRLLPLVDADDAGTEWLVELGAVSETEVTLLVERNGLLEKQVLRLPAAQDE